MQCPRNLAFSLEWNYYATRPTWKDGTWQAEAMMHIFLVWDYYAENTQTNRYMQWNEHTEITHHLVCWEGIHYDLSTNYRCLAMFVSQKQGGYVDKANIVAIKTVCSWLYLSFTQQLSIFSVHLDLIPHWFVPLILFFIPYMLDLITSIILSFTNGVGGIGIF